MNEKEKELVDKFLSEMREILMKKSEDYSGVESALKNFKRLEDIGVDAKLSVFIRLSDKYNRLKNFFKTKEFKVKEETIKDTLLDLANYCILLYLAFEEDKRQI